LLAGRERADVVAGGEVVAESLSWWVPVRADVEERAGARVGEQPAPGAGGICGQPSSGLGGDRSVAGHVGGLALCGLTNPTVPRLTGSRAICSPAAQLRLRVLDVDQSVSVCLALHDKDD